MTSQQKSAWLVVGLGNPGDKYSATRHNIGFVVADTLAARLNAKFSSHKNRAQIAQCRLGLGADAPSVVIVKPQTYMNDSGDAVAPLAQYFNCAPGFVIAIHDELDIPFETLRVKIGGGDNGHNGLKSLTQSLKTPEYFRLRVGIGRPTTPQNPADYVLDTFSKIERPLISEIANRACDAIESLIINGLELTQQNFNK